MLHTSTNTEFPLDEHSGKVRDDPVDETDEGDSR